MATKTKAPKNPTSISDLTEADYNPRVITNKQLASLKSSYKASGDLSGVVFNTASGVLISGHQRIKTIKDYKTRIVKTACKPDGNGTVATGHIEVKTTEGNTFRIPYREVHWTDKQAEMAANVAANAAGGKFDETKLGAILARLAKGKFDIEKTGMDSWSASKAIIAFNRSNTDGDGGDRAGAKDVEHEVESEFNIIDPTAMKFKHVCPKCQYQWGDVDKSAASKFKPDQKSKLVESDAWGSDGGKASSKTKKTKSVVAPAPAPAVKKKAKR